MKKIKEAFHNKFLTPQKSISRYFDSLLIFAVAISSLFMYYLIVYELCFEDACEHLIVTKPLLDMSFLYLIYAAALFAVGVFILTAKELPVIYGLAITLVCLSSFVLCAFSLFMMFNELAAYA